MSALAPALEAFFTERLTGQRNASPNTVAAYRDTWRLVLRFVHARTGKEPCQLDLADLDASTIGAFLEHLENDRRNSVRTRNARLAGIRSFFRYAALRHPEHAALIARVLAIPAKRCERPEVSYLTSPELDALLAAPDRGSWTGRRDHALLDMAAQTGLRVSELTGLRNCDVELGTGAHVSCTGKGRKQRCTPLNKSTVAVLRTWMREPGGEPGDPLFPARRGTRLTRGAVERPGHQARRYRPATMPVPGSQAPYAPRPEAHLRHAALALGSGHVSDRPMARPRAVRDNQPDLPSRRSVHQRTSPRAHRPPAHKAGTLPGIRPVAGLPRQPLIMRPPQARIRSPARDPPRHGP